MAPDADTDSADLVEVERAKCFVLMPFGDPVGGYYEAIYKPAIEAAGLSPGRADDLLASTAIIGDIWRGISEAAVVLADLSGMNPNVFYELGLAHAAQKPAVLTTSNLEDVPFDLRHLRVLTYDVAQATWAQDLHHDVAQALSDTISAPIENVLPAFLGRQPSFVGDQEARVQQLESGLAALGKKVDANFGISIAMG